MTGPRLKAPLLGYVSKGTDRDIANGRAVIEVQIINSGVVVAEIARSPSRKQWVVTEFNPPSTWMSDDIRDVVEKLMAHNQEPA